MLKYIKYVRSIGTGTFLLNFFVQRICRVNAHVPVMLHFTSKVAVAEKLTFDSSNVYDSTCISLASSPGLYINAYSGVRIETDVLIASGVKLISANHDFNNRSKHVKTDPIVIKKNAWIGANTVILPGVKIGENTIIGAGSVVTKTIPDNVIAAGNPAKIIRALNA